MKVEVSRRFIVAVAATSAISASAGTFALAQNNALKLLLNGKVASTRIRVLGGQPYVPLTDIARALGQSVAKTSGGYEIGTAGGANQIAGLTGKVGDTLFDGSWRFQVTKVTEAQTYSDRYTQKRPEEYTAEENSKLVLVDVTVKNGTLQQNSLSMSQFDGKNNTSLAGADGSSIPRTSYDLRSGDGVHWGAGGASDGTPNILPGAKQDFTIIFKVPKNFQPKDLIYTLAYQKDPLSPAKHVDLRVSLQP